MGLGETPLKKSMRAGLLALRARLDPGVGVRLAGHVLRACAPAAGAVVGGYWGFRGEIDVGALMLALVGRGHVVGLPVTPGRGEALAFRRWRPGEGMISGRFGTLHPQGEVVRPDYLLVPLVAFDRRGYRLGYGGGFYDRTIAGLAGVRTVGCGFAGQEVPVVPVEGHDRRLDLIATEDGIVFPED